MSNQNANKAALYSAFLFPGVGLWWLKHYVRAAIFIVPALLALIYIAKKLYDAITPVYANLQRKAQEGLIDPLDLAGNYGKLSADLHQSIAAQQDQLFTVEAILIACWLCSIVSSYFAGKKLDLEAAASATKS